jgi:meso-butanediol dehydrogenase/(S,S)-butanediol dehydrogenase/diacetyl reductase
VKFNNAGVNKPMNFMDVTEDNWNFIMGVNGLGCLIGMQEAARQMIAQGAAARSSTPPPSPAARASTMSRPIAPRNGRWSADPVGRKATWPSMTSPSPASPPGVVATEMWEQVDEDLMDIGAAERPGEGDGRVFRRDPARARGAPEDITGTTTFLASRDSDYMTGQIVMIDGGMTLV